MRLAAQEQLVPGETLEQKWEVCRRVGIEGLELQGHGDGRFQARLPELRRAQAAGVPLASVCVMMDHFIGDFDAARRADALASMQSLLSVIAEVGGGGAITPAAYGQFSRRLPPFTPPRDPEGDREVLLAGLSALAEHAAREGATVFLEPLNRYEDHMLNRLDQAVELCEAVGSESVQVMGDLFHMSIEEDDLAASIRATGRRLAHVHLADSNRMHPGTGHTDFGSAFAALREIGFGGWLALECGLRGDPEAALRDVATLLRPLLTGGDGENGATG